MLSRLFPSDDTLRRRRDRVLAALALVAAVFLFARAMHKDEGVLVRNREFGARFLAGADPYFDPAAGQRVHGPYPPSYVLVTVPLALVPEGVARAGWALLQIAALAALYVLMRAWLRRGWPGQAPHAPMLFAIALLLSSRYLLRDMAGGGGNLVYATLVLWGVEFALRERPIAGGGLLALSLVLKPNLAPFLVCLLCLRLWRALACCVVGIGLLVFLPGSFFGIEEWSALVVRWVHDVARFGGALNLADAAEIPDGFPLANTTMNQSAREALWRALSPEAAAWSARFVAFALLAAASWLAARARDDRGRILAVVLFLPVSLLISPISWKAHHVVLTALFFVLLAEVRAGRRKWLGILLVVYYGACVLLSEELVGKAMKNTLQALSVVTWGALVLFVAGVIVARQRERDAGGAA